MKHSLGEAYVIHRRQYQDNSLLLELFTLTEGRLAVIARGAASAKSSRKGLLQPFIPLLASWSGRGEIKTLGRLESTTRPLSLQGRRLYCGFYLNELLMRLTERYDPYPELFHLYSGTLNKLAHTVDIEVLLRRFELGLLAQLGYAMELKTEAVTGKNIDPNAFYTYQAESGAVHSPVRGNANLVQGATLLALADVDSVLSPEQKKQARNLMREILKHYLGEKPLKSRELFKETIKA